LDGHDVLLVVGAQPLDARLALAERGDGATDETNAALDHLDHARRERVDDGAAVDDRLDRARLSLGARRSDHCNARWSCRPLGDVHLAENVLRTVSPHPLLATHS